MPTNFDVIIVGAGPAGTTLGNELAQKGISVAILEKAKLPRYKCCAGGLTLRAAKLLHKDVADILEKEITGAVFTYAGSKSHFQHDDRVIGYTLMRDKLDYTLVKQAEKNGVMILQEHEVKGISLNGQIVRVFTNEGDFQSKFVVGADGSMGAVVRSLNFNRKMSNIIAIESEVTVSEAARQRWDSKVSIDLGRVPGYAWIFPKSRHLSIGVGCHRLKAKDLKKHFKEYLDSLHLGTYTIDRWQGSIIPICKGKVSAVHGRALLLGDAAGLADPLTGEGIYSAVLSARIAAPVIVKSLQENSGNLADYQVALEKEVMPDLKVANFISNVFLKFPSITYEALNRDKRIWMAGCALLRGEISYKGIQNRLKTLGGLYKILTGR